jgi:hypothetical protein
MTKLNIETVGANLHNGTSELAGRTFTEAFALLGKAFNQRLQIERDSLGESFDADTFWHDNDLAESVIQSAIKKPAMKNDGSPKMRKGQPVFTTSRMNQRVIASAASIVRSGVRSVRALAALTSKSASIEEAVKNADSLGNILGMVRRLAQAGLVTDNKAANVAKNAAIEAYKAAVETPNISAKRALIASLYGQPVTTAQVKQLGEALTQFSEDLRTARKIVTDSRPFVAPAPLTFAGIFGTVVEITRKRAPRKPVVKPEVQSETLPEVIEPATGTEG